MTTPKVSLEEYNKAIVGVRNKTTEEDFSKLTRNIYKLAHMYSNTKVPTARFELDGKLITRNNSLVIGYKCLRCEVVNEITLNLYIRKVNKNIIGCDACKNNDSVKREAHSLFMKENCKALLKSEFVATPKPRWMDKPLAERLEDSKKCFEEEDDDFKSSYLLAHLNLDEFEGIRSKILSIGNGKLKDLEGWCYIPFYKIGNQTKYTPMLYCLEKNELIKPNYVEWRCESCESVFKNRDIEIQKNRIKMLCNDCTFCNKVFKICSMSSPWGKINYQGQYEKRFIDWCVENGVQILNGPTIEYEWKEIPRKYKVDFELPAYKKLVELKDNHIWHKMQVESGKWGAKETIAKKWCEEKGWEYRIVFPKTMSSWKEELKACKI